MKQNGRYVSVPRALMSRGRATLLGAGPAASDEVVVAVDEPACPPGKRMNVEPCHTELVRSRGDNRPTAPWETPCGYEPSPLIQGGRFELDGIYASCDFRLIVSDIPVNDLGVVSSFRAVCETCQGAGRSVDSQPEATFSSTMNFVFTPLQTPPARKPVFGSFYFRMAWTISQTQALQFSVRTENFVDLTGAPVVRAFTIQMLENCPSAEFYFLCAAQQGGGATGFPITSTWAPIAATIPPVADPVVPTQIVVTGFPSGGGTASAGLIGANSDLLATLWGGINNAD